MYTRERAPQRVILLKLVVEQIIVLDAGLDLLLQGVDLVLDLYLQPLIIIKCFLFLGQCLLKLVQDRVSHHLSLLELQLLCLSHMLRQLRLDPGNSPSLRLIFLLLQRIKLLYCSRSSVWIKGGVFF